MNDQDQKSESKGETDAVDPDDNASTTLTTRMWAAKELNDLLALLTPVGNADKILWSELADFAEDQTIRSKAKWPRWLVVGIAAKIANRWAKEKLDQDVAAPASETAKPKSRAKKEKP